MEQIMRLHHLGSQVNDSANGLRRRLPPLHPAEQVDTEPKSKGLATSQGRIVRVLHPCALPRRRRPVLSSNPGNAGVFRPGATLHNLLGENPSQKGQSPQPCWVTGGVVANYAQKGECCFNLRPEDEIN